MKKTIVFVFLVELLPALFWPLFCWRMFTPNNVIYQSPDLLRTWGDLGMSVGHLAFLPGILGWMALKPVPKSASPMGLRIAANILAILHIAISALLFGLYALAFISVVFLGVTH